jgi:hypothetical protein
MILMFIVPRFQDSKVLRFQGSKVLGFQGSKVDSFKVSQLPFQGLVMTFQLCSHGSSIHGSKVGMLRVEIQVNPCP